MSRTKKDKLMNDKNIFDYIEYRWANMTDDEKEKYDNNINLLAMEYFN